jgi:hypothetical protein
MNFYEHRMRLIGILVLGFLSVTGAGGTVFAADFTPLIGRWQRTDGGYIIEVRSIEADGKMATGYFNPRPIHVSRAQVSTYKDYLKVEVELRDRGYPGSTYTLIYDSDRDTLIGHYFHAASGQNFDVVFVRRR